MMTKAVGAFSEAEVRAQIASVPVWFHQIELAPGIVTPGRDNSALKLQRLNIPLDLSGKRVLDIGANDGFFSFECERRGAEVIAIDESPTPGFSVAHELLGSRVKFYILNIYELTPDTFGQFDVVLCLGVLYHLRHPLFGLERIHAICNDLLIIETQTCDNFFIDDGGVPHDLAAIAPTLPSIPIAQFYPGVELNGDITNWWSPNILALHGMLRSTGFVPQQTIPAFGRVCVHCIRVEPPTTEGWLAHIVDVSSERRADRDMSGNGSVDAPAIAPQNQQGPYSQYVLAQSLADVILTQSQQNLHLQQVVEQREARIADLEARAGWLEEQSREARRALVAVEQGRVLRLLRWLSRAK
jgi:tRNA (mo5U34)-methyltransferase